MARWRKACPASLHRRVLGGWQHGPTCIGLAGAYASHKRIQAPQRVVVMVDRTDVRSTPSLRHRAFQLLKVQQHAGGHDTEDGKSL